MAKDPDASNKMWFPRMHSFSIGLEGVSSFRAEDYRFRTVDCRFKTVDPRFRAVDRRFGTVDSGTAKELNKSRDFRKSLQMTS